MKPNLIYVWKNKVDTCELIKVSQIKDLETNLVKFVSQ